MLQKLNPEDFDSVFQLMEVSFPKEEHRPYTAQKALLQKPAYDIYTLADTDRQLKAFMAVWDFPSLLYVEHFAVNPACRNGGIGAKMLQEMSERFGKMLCLEVEPPENELAVRRVRFYQRNDFYFNDYPYIQPAMAKHLSAIPLYIMTSGKAINQTEFHQIKDLLYTHVYEQKGDLIP